MKYLNLGCGTNHSTAAVWTNLDFYATGETVIAHNLLQGIPFEDNTFGLVYHSHVLEHFTRADGEKLIEECFRVLKPGGVIRIAIPDLEGIVKNYLHFLNEGMAHPDDELIRANYEWMLLELYDQTVRNQTEGNMGKYLRQNELINEEFVLKRIGGEGMEIREDFFDSLKNTSASSVSLRSYLGKIKRSLKSKLEERLPYLRQQKIGAFRQGGEIHQWMYDRYSLTNLLKSKGGSAVEVRDAFTSYITEWAAYEIEGKYPTVRKPDSLFIECLK